MKSLAFVLLMVTSSAHAMSRAEIDCIAYAVYHEARDQSVKGWSWVADVIYNRGNSKGYPRNLCSVIKQKAQFSFWRGKRVKIRDSATFYKIRKVVSSKRWRGQSRGAMWYHAKYVKPKWRKRLTRIAAVGDHIFYKRKV